MAGARRRRAWYGSLGAIVGLVAALAGRPAAAQAPLTLDEVRERARSASADVREAEARLIEAEAQVDRAWSRILPQVVAQGGWTRNDREIAIALPAIPGASADPPIFQHESLFSASIEVQTQLFDPALPAGVRGASAALASGREQLEALRQRLELAAIELFSQLYSVDLLLESAGADLAILEENARLVAARRDVEAATDFEVSRAETEVLSAQLDLESLQQQRRQLARGLAELIGAEEPPGQLAAPPIQAAPEAPDANTLVAAALERRADVRAARDDLASAEDLLRSARLEYWPDVVASGQYRVSSEEALDGESTAWAITLGLRWLIFDRGQQGVRVDEADSHQQAATARLEGLETTVGREVRDALDAVETTQRRSEIAERQAELAETALEQANAGYAQDVLTSLDVLEAQAALLRAHNAAIAAQLERDVALWRLRHASGEL